MERNLFTEARPNIFLTSFFRSGSSHVKMTLLKILPGYRPATTVFTVGPLGNDACNIHLSAAQVLFMIPEQVFHQHTLGTSGNSEILKLFKVKPIVMMRNILDCMASLHELLCHSYSGNAPRGLYDQNIGIYYPPYWADMTEEEQLWWMTYNVPNWFFTFYMSWINNTQVDVLPVWYDIYYKDQVAGVRRILDHTGISSLGHIKDEDIDFAANNIGVGSRFVFGLPGRGKEKFTGRMISCIEDQATSWGKKVGKELIKELIER